MELWTQWAEREGTKELTEQKMSDLLQDHLIGALMRGIGTRLVERQIDAWAAAPRMQAGLTIRRRHSLARKNL
jgi:hypothetical protein